jgi:hypothetical protein
MTGGGMRLHHDFDEEQLERMQLEPRREELSAVVESIPGVVPEAACVWGRDGSAVCAGWRALVRHSDGTRPGWIHKIWRRRRLSRAMFPKNSAIVLRGPPKISEISARLSRPGELFIQGHERIRGVLARSEIRQNAHRGTRPGQCLDAALRRSWCDPL